MFEWFEKVAPIKDKFRTLLIVHTFLAALSLAASVLIYAGFGVWPLVLSALVAIIVPVTVHVSGRLIAGPYVNMIERIEGVAAGDLASSIDQVDHRDCVGRLARAASVLRDNAEKIRIESENRERVVRELAGGLEHLAAGDLTYKIEQPFAGEHEALRISFNRAVAGLDQSLGQVAASAQSVHAGSTEIRAASEDLSRRTEQQAASLEETAAAMSQVTGMVAQSARNAGEVSSSIKAAHQDATEGGEVVKQAVSAMDAIERSSQEIGQIINVIDGIAFQTNLLALNAGVEAARAGEAGKGFAVVANEVRALAQRSADAAKDIKALITTSSEQVHHGVGLVGETGKMLSRIVTKISDINALIGEMASGTEMQATNLQQINASVGDMDKMTQQNAAMVEQTTAAARNLANEADELAGLVSDFRLSSGTLHRASAPVRAVASRVASAPPRRPAPIAMSGNLALKNDENLDWEEF